MTVYFLPSEQKWVIIYPITCVVYKNTSNELIFTIKEVSQIKEIKKEEAKTEKGICVICKEEREIVGGICKDCLDNLIKKVYNNPHCRKCSKFLNVDTPFTFLPIKYSSKEEKYEPFCMYCKEIVKEKAFICKECKKVFLFQFINGIKIKKYYFCKNCYPKHFPVKRYSYKPSPIFHTSSHCKSRPFYGLELEIEFKEIPEKFSAIRDKENAYEYYTILAEKANKIKNFLRKMGLENFIYLKMDASIGGLEIVSHPFSEEWWKENKRKIRKLLFYLKKIKATSYATGRCGLHVHVSKPTKYYYRKIWLFFQKNYYYIKEISQRGKNEFCNFPTFLNPFSYFDKLYYLNDHYYALNLGHTSTLEIRFFRGTLNSTVLLGIIQFIFATMLFTTLHPTTFLAEKVSWRAFIKWCKENNYSDFIKFWKEFAKKRKIED